MDDMSGKELQEDRPYWDRATGLRPKQLPREWDVGADAGR